MWYSTETCNRDSKILIYKFSSILHHINNKYPWLTEEGQMSCEHKKIPEEVQRKINGLTHIQNRLIFLNKSYNR